MSQSADVKVRIRQEGAESTKQALLETKAALLGVSTEQIKAAHTTRELARDANALNNMERLKTRIWLAQHPTLNNLTRAMSTFGSVARGVLSVTTAFSTAILAFNSTQSGLTEVQANLDQAKREQALALNTYGYDSEEYANATEDVNKFTTELANLQTQTAQEKMVGILNLGAMIGVIGSSAVNVVQSGALTKLASSLTLVGTAGWFSLGPLVLIVGLIAAVAAALYMILTPGDAVVEFFKTFFPDATEQIDAFSKQVDDVFTMHIPNAFIFMANSALDIFDTVVKGAESMVNGVIAGINEIIKSVNRIASSIGLPKIGLLSTVSFGSITGGARIPYLQSRDTSTSSTSSTMVPTAAAAGGKAAPVVNNYYTIQGSVLSEMELQKIIDKTMKEKLKQQGWN